MANDLVVPGAMGSPALFAMTATIQGGLVKMASDYRVPTSPVSVSPLGVQYGYDQVSSFNPDGVASFVDIHPKLSRLVSPEEGYGTPVDPTYFRPDRAPYQIEPLFAAGSRIFQSARHLQFEIDKAHSLLLANIDPTSPLRSMFYSYDYLHTQRSSSLMLFAYGNDGLDISIPQSTAQKASLLMQAAKDNEDNIAKAMLYVEASKLAYTGILDLSHFPPSVTDSKNAEKVFQESVHLATESWRDVVNSTDSLLMTFDRSVALGYVTFYAHYFNDEAASVALRATGDAYLMNDLYYEAGENFLRGAILMAYLAYQTSGTNNIPVHELECLSTLVGMLEFAWATGRPTPESKSVDILSGALPLTAVGRVKDLKRQVDDALAQAREDYDKALTIL